MKKSLTVCKVVALAFVIAFAFTAAAFAQEATYVGNSQCKICHNKKEEGEQWTKWKASEHSKAFEKLSSPEAKAAATKAGVTKAPAEAPECLQCHVTGADAATGKCPDKIQAADGVQCESCHGPASLHTAEGKKFKSGDKTAEPAKKINGHPTADTCKKCHNEKNPTAKAGEAFDFDKMKAKIDHSNPTKAKK